MKMKMKIRGKAREKEETETRRTTMPQHGANVDGSKAKEVGSL